jgi:enoyl-CoA hydratase/carnithine racemase
MGDHVRISDEGDIRVLRMNRPDKKNALTAPMYEAMAAALESAGDVTCVLIAGVPGAFCAGNDLQDFADASARGEGLDAAVLRFLYALARCDTPLFAAVQGIAVGIGTTMLLHCDYVVAGTDARFSTPFVRLGLVPEAASSLLAPRRMGHARAFAMLIMGQTLDADAAKTCGIVNAVVAPADVEAEAMKAAHELAALPPQAVRESRRLLRGTPDERIARIDEEAAIFKTRLASAEARAAFDAFLSRRR